MKLDFSTLSTPVTRAEIDEYRLEREGKNKLTFASYLVGAIVAGGLVCSFVWLAPGGYAPFAALVVVMGVACLLALAAYRGVVSNYGKKIRLNRLAESNGLRYKHDERNIDGYAGLIFGAGHSKVIHDVLVAADGTEMGNYTYVTGGGKSRSTHNRGFIKIKLPRRLPHMVLDAKHNNFWALSNLPAIFDKSQVLSLEGDFNNYYTLYAPKQYERDALYVFTPDVMAAFVDRGAKYDAEVIDDYLYIYHSVHFQLDSEDELLSLQAIVNTLGNEMQQQTQRYQDERVTAAKANVVAHEGARLKRGVNYIVVAIVATLFFYQVAYAIMPTGMQVVASLMLTTVVWCGVGYGIYRSIMRNRRS